MKVTLIKQKENSVDLELDNTGLEFKELPLREYRLIIESKEDYEVIESELNDMIIEGIDIIQFTPNVQKLELFKNKIFSAPVNIMIFSTNDKYKFGMLDDFIKNIMQNVDDKKEES